MAVLRCPKRQDYVSDGRIVQKAMTSQWLLSRSKAGFCSALIVRLVRYWPHGNDSESVARYFRSSNATDHLLLEAVEFEVAFA